MDPSERTLDHFSTLLATKGLQAALRYLNSGVPHRYSAVYRFEGELLRNVALYDKQERMRPEYLIAVPFKQSFCQFVLRDQAFRTENFELDDRLAGHPYRGGVVSYHSVPVVDEQGTFLGTMSHFEQPWPGGLSVRTAPSRGARLDRIPPASGGLSLLAALALP